MKATKNITDKFAIGLSLACVIHCLVLPLLVVLLPNFLVLQLSDEKFHFWMVIAVIPTSLYALFMGCKKHKDYRIFTIGVTGLLLLILAVTLDHELIGEIGEKSMTVIGALLIALAHFFNFRFCQKAKDGVCSEKE